MVCRVDPSIAALLDESLVRNRWLNFWLEQFQSLLMEKPCYLLPRLLTCRVAMKPLALWDADFTRCRFVPSLPPVSNFACLLSFTRPKEYYWLGGGLWPWALLGSSLFAAAISQFWLPVIIIFLAIASG